MILQVHIANASKRGGIKGEDGDDDVDHVGEPSMAEDQEAGIPDGVAYATLLFLVFISTHNLPFRY